MDLCPLCGGKAKTITGAYRDGGYIENSAYVVCEECGLRTSEISECMPEDEVERIAIEEWNSKEVYK